VITSPPPLPLHLPLSLYPALAYKILRSQEEKIFHQRIYFSFFFFGETRAAILHITFRREKKFETIYTPRNRRRETNQHSSPNYNQQQHDTKIVFTTVPEKLSCRSLFFPNLLANNGIFDGGFMCIAV